MAFLIITPSYLTFTNATGQEYFTLDDDLIVNGYQLLIPTKTHLQVLSYCSSTNHTRDQSKLLAFQFFGQALIMLLITLSSSANNAKITFLAILKD